MFIYLTNLPEFFRQRHFASPNFPFPLFRKRAIAQARGLEKSVAFVRMTCDEKQHGAKT
jgi:hypothetical protein